MTQGPAHHVVGTAPDRAGLLAAYTELCTALLERDGDVLERLLDVDFTAQHVTGHVASRCEWLGQIASGEFSYHSIEQGLTHATVQADRGTVDGYARYHVTLGGYSGTYDLHSVMQFVWRRDAWRATNGVSTLESEPADTGDHRDDRS